MADSSPQYTKILVFGSFKASKGSDKINLKREEKNGGNSNIFKVDSGEIRHSDKKRQNDIIIMVLKNYIIKVRLSKLETV